MNEPQDKPQTPGKGWKYVGLRYRPGKRIRVVPTALGWVVFVVLGFFAVSAGFMEYSMQPDFCRSCHLMEPYYQAWHDSTHSDIPCGDCHFEPGWRNTFKGKFEASSQAVKYITGTYGSKPHAEVRDSSCLRSGCHEHRVLEGKVNWTVPTQHGEDVTIHFDHAPHLGEMRRGKQLRCVSCHSQIVQGQHITVTLDTCFLCHFKGLKHGRDDETLGGCGSCHSAPEGEIHMTTGIFNHADYLERGVECQNCHSDAVKGDGAVPRQMCWNCHNDPQQLKRYNDTSFIHQQHVTDHKVECSSCHVQIEHHLTAAVPQGVDLMMGGHVLENSGTCGQCHEQSHIGPLDIYRGVGGRGVADMPSAMYRAQVDCIACHTVKEYATDVASVTGQTYVAAQERCNACHDTKYDGTLDVWRATISDHLARAENLYEQAEAAVDETQLDEARRLQARRMLDDAAHNIRMVKLGHGVHNVTYATALLNVAIDHCRRIVDGDIEPMRMTERTSE